MHNARVACTVNHAPCTVTSLLCIIIDQQVFLGTLFVHFQLTTNHFELELVDWLFFRFRHSTHHFAIYAHFQFVSFFCFVRIDEIVFLSWVVVNINLQSRCVRARPNSSTCS